MNKPAVCLRVESVVSLRAAPALQVSIQSL